MALQDGVQWKKMYNINDWIECDGGHRGGECYIYMGGVMVADIWGGWGDLYVGVSESLYQPDLHINS